MVKTVEVEIHNLEGCPLEIFGGFDSFPHIYRIKKGDKVKVMMPVTSYLAEYKKLVIRKNKDGDSIPTPEGRRSKYMLKQIEQWRKEANEPELQHRPLRRQIRRGVLD